MTEFRAYAQRRLSPFQGTVQVLEVDDGRALSYDGWSWHIQLRAQQAVTQMAWGNIGPGQTTRPFFHYASWSSDGALRRLPINPMLGDVSAYPALQALLQLLPTAPAPPFALADRYECWLVDADDAPLALFASACDDAARSLPQHPRWQTVGSDDAGFHSQALAESAAALRGPHAAWLVDAVVRCTGMPLRLHWFRREADGGGVGIDGRHIPSGCAQRTAPAGGFPPLLLREDWPDPLAAAVVRDYLAWLAPYLLTLPDLPEARRAALEVEACRHPQRLARVWRLLPRVLDRERVEAALVRARLELANS